MDDRRFDDLSRLISTKTSRGQVLKILVGTVLGGLFLREGTVEALAAKGCAPNKLCAHWCASVFGEDTAAAEQCSSDAAHCTGVCYSCGPASSHAVAPEGVCCARNSNGYCTSYTVATCCASGYPCVNGVCAVPCSNPTGLCGDIAPCLVGSCAGACVQSVDGNAYCSELNGNHCSSCSANSDCRPGMICITIDSPCCGAPGRACAPATCVTSTHSCFTGATLVTMSDGTSRSINRVQVGDLVVGSEGQANRVLHIEKPALGPRTLYALNDGDYFVTAEHPFMTEHGWKSIDPAALADERSLLRVARLTVGDRVLTLTGVAAPVGGPAHGEAMEVRVEVTMLERIVGTTADPTTPLYNLRLDGDHTYFANGLLVHNK